jgi:hypothetical protein
LTLSAASGYGPHDASQAIAVFALAALLLAGRLRDDPKPSRRPRPPLRPGGGQAAGDEKAKAEEARAMLAQAETDVQRARSKRALWLRGVGRAGLRAARGGRNDAQGRDRALAPRQANSPSSGSSNWPIRREMIRRQLMMKR